MSTIDAELTGYERALQEFREASAALADTLRKITEVVTRLRDWPQESADALIDGLPPDWPDEERLVALIAAYGRAKEAALRAWVSIPPEQRDGVAAPEQVLSPV